MLELQTIALINQKGGIDKNINLGYSINIPRGIIKYLFGLVGEEINEESIYDNANRKSRFR